jgi:hypothetical protein
MAIRKLVSVCTIRDIRIWKLAANRILGHIRADKYELIVPREQRPAFEKATPSKFIIKSDEDYISDARRGVISGILASKRESSVNWYIQQFLKIASAASEDDDDVVVIWDGDTIPIKDISFVGDGGVLYCYKSDEYHRPYFDTIKKLLGIERLSNHSFISQCFPTYSGWVRGMISEIEGKAGKNWMEAICDAIDGPGSQFSEYETIGNYALARYPRMIAFNDRPWFRDGAKVFKRYGKIRKLEKTFENFDFIAIEHQDLQKPLYRALYGKFRNIVRKIRGRFKSEERMAR